MAREDDLPRFLAAVHPRWRVPHRAELAVGAIVIVTVAFVDLRGAIGFSSFGVLIYYFIANAAACRQSGDARRYPRALQVLGADRLHGARGDAARRGGHRRGDRGGDRHPLPVRAPASRAVTGAHDGRMKAWRMPRRRVDRARCCERAAREHRRPSAAHHEPRQGALSRDGDHQRRGDRLLHADRPDDDPACRRATGDPQALAERRRHRRAPRAVVLRERPRARRARLGATAADPALRRAEGLSAHRRRADAGVPRAGREPRAARAAVALHAGGDAGGCRPPRARPRSGPGGGARRVRRGRPVGARDPRPHGPGSVPGDQRQQGHPAVFGAAARAEQRVRVGDRARAGSSDRGRSPRPRRQQHEEGDPRRPRAHRLEPEQRRQDDDRPVLAARARASERRRAAHVGRARRSRSRPALLRRGARARRDDRRSAVGARVSTPAAGPPRTAR